VKDAASAVKSFLGPPSILINNAGIAYAHTCLDTTPLQLRKLFDINVLSHYFTIQAFLPSMIERKKGHIIATCSLATFVSPAELVDYAATKSAVYSIYEGLREELKYRYDAPEVQTTTVHPTYVKTKLIGPYAASLEKSKALVIDPETVADAVVKQILTGQGGQIILPRHLGFLTLARGLPSWFVGLLGAVTKNDIRAATTPSQ
jgi:all-trans-retinol dehydrogenase (NAD+)